MNRRYAGISASLIILILLVVITSLVAPGGDTPAEAGGNNRCADIEYVGMAPVVSEDSIAFGPNVAEFIEGFDTLVQTPEGLIEVVNAVRGEQVNATCRYSAMALALAMHRGLEPWPSSDQDWIDRFTAIDSDREAHHALANKVLDWNDAAQAEIVFLNEPYNSDWFERTGYGPFLRQGPGHSDVAGWVVRWTHVNEDGTTTVVTERLVCYYQFVGEIPPSVPPVGIPPSVTPTPTTTVPGDKPPMTTIPPGTVPPTTIPPGTTVPTTTPPMTTVPSSTVPPTTVRCGDKANQLPDDTCGVTVSTTPRSPVTVPTTTVVHTLPPVAPSNTLPAGVTPTTLDYVPTPTNQLPDGPPVTAVTPVTTVAPPDTTPTNIGGTVCPPQRQPCA